MLFGGQTRPPKGSNSDRVELVDIADEAHPAEGVDEAGLFKLGPPAEDKCSVEPFELTPLGCSFDRSVRDKN